MEPMLATTEDIRYAYRLLLGREPDAEGLGHHCVEAAAHELSPPDLAKSFIASAEFAARNQALPVEVKLDGYSVFIRPDDHDIGQHIEATHEYEPHVTAALRERLRPGHVFVDIGANVGFFTQMAAHLVGPTGMVVAVEPMDKNLQLIFRGIEQNNFEHVSVHACAASDRVEVVCVATGPGTSNGQVLAASVSGNRLLFTQTRRLDDLVKDLDRIDLVKLDIEGYELRAWRGMQRSLAKHRPTILSEFHPHCMRTHVGIDPLDYLDALFKYGNVRVLHYHGGSVECAVRADVMGHWEAGDKAGRGDGKHHLDLLIQPGQ